MPALPLCHYSVPSSIDLSAGLTNWGLRIPIRQRIRKTPRLDNLLHCAGVRELSKLCTAELLSFAPRRCYDDVYLSALVRSLAAYLEQRGTLATPSATPSERMVGAYRDYLDQVRDWPH